MDLKKVIIGMGIAANAVLTGVMLGISAKFYLFAYRVEWLCILCVLNIALLSFAGMRERYLVRLRMTAMFVLLGISLLFFALAPKITVRRAREILLADPAYAQAVIVREQALPQKPWPGFLLSRVYQFELKLPTHGEVVTVSPTDGSVSVVQ